MPDIQGLTIIIPLFDSSRTIERALNSIALAVSPSIGNANPIYTEAIAVFDGEDRASLTIVERIAPNFPCHLEVAQKSHSGVSATRNLGLKLARTSHVTFLDADDEITAERHRLAGRGRDALYVGRQRVVYDTESPRPAGIQKDSSQPTPNFTSVVAPTELLIGLGGFDPMMDYGADIDLVIRARDAGHTVTIVDDITTIRHVTGRNASLATDLATRDFFLSLRKRQI